MKKALTALLLLLACLSVDAEITLRFAKDAEGRVNELFVINEEGESHRGQRIQPAP